MVGHLVNALPWVIHSLQARTGAAELPQPFLRCLVQSCTAALAACAQAGYDEPGQHNPYFLPLQIHLLEPCTSKVLSASALHAHMSLLRLNLQQPYAALWHTAGLNMSKGSNTASFSS